MKPTSAPASLCIFNVVERECVVQGDWFGTVEGIRSINAADFLGLRGAEKASRPDGLCLDAAAGTSIKHESPPEA
jgi:hypothetical protein